MNGNPETLIDIVSCLIVPYLIHFGERGITPRILKVEGEELITIEKAQGPRLGELLEKADLERLTRIYHQLGTSVGYISKYKIVHDDLHPDNVVVCGDKPVIIDWGKASYFGIAHTDSQEACEFWMERDSGILLYTTQGRLITARRRELFPTLKEAYAESFVTEFRKPLDVDHREIQRRAEAMLYR